MEVRRLGLVPYVQAWKPQNRLADERRAGAIPATLVLLQHPHTSTLGRLGTRDHVYLTDAELSERGITCLEVDRGGDVTYHGPGQLVVYPIRRLERFREVVPLVRALEGVVSTETFLYLQMVKQLYDWGTRVGEAT